MIHLACSCTFTGMDLVEGCPFYFIRTKHQGLRPVPSFISEVGCTGWAKQPSDHLSQGFKIPPGALGTIPESCRPVQVQEQVARKTSVYTLKCPKSVILGQFRV